MTQDEFYPIFKEVCEAYGERLKFQPSVMQTWFKILKQWTSELVEAAALEYMSSPSPYPPTPGQINSLAKKRAGTTNADAVGGIEDVDIPMHELYAHYRAYWEDGSYREESWNRIIDLFKKANRPSMVEYAQYKHNIIITDMNNEAQTMPAL